MWSDILGVGIASGAVALLLAKSKGHLAIDTRRIGMRLIWRGEPVKDSEVASPRPPSLPQDPQE